MCVAFGFSSRACKYARTADPCCPKLAWLMPKFNQPRAYLCRVVITALMKNSSNYICAYDIRKIEE